MVSLGSGAERQIDDVMLTRYACYLIAQNGDPRKSEFELWQTNHYQRPKTVSVILGHSNVATTLNLYVHSNIDQKKRCIARMNKFLKMD